MTSEPYVLVISTVVDVATDDVVRRLTTKGIRFKRINTEEFPFNRGLALQYGLGSTGKLEIDGEPVCTPSAIWYRRLRAPAKPSEMDPGIYEFCMQEARAALLGGILGLPGRWMSHPARVWEAEFKPFQLAVASDIGLAIPRTAITNQPATVREAFSRFGEMIVKPTRTGYVVKDGEEHAIFTSKLLSEHIEHLEGASLSPAIYQELIPKKFDIRATIVGKHVYAAAIDSQRDPLASIDWRHTENPDLPHHAVKLPGEVEARLLELMRRLGLTFGAIDLVQTPDDEYIFLEVNPNGQWLWIDDKLQLGISEAVADWLSGSDQYGE